MRTWFASTGWIGSFPGLAPIHPFPGLSHKKSVASQHTAYFGNGGVNHTPKFDFIQKSESDWVDFFGGPIMRAIAFLVTCAIGALPVVASAQMQVEPLPPVPGFEPLHNPSASGSVAVQKSQHILSARTPEAKVLQAPAPGVQPARVAQPNARLAMSAPIAQKSSAYSKPAPQRSPSQSFGAPKGIAGGQQLEVVERTIFSRQGDTVRMMIVREYVQDGRIVAAEGVEVVGKAPSGRDKRSFREGSRPKDASESSRPDLQQAKPEKSEGPYY
jgi:hypothetical protein